MTDSLDWLSLWTAGQLKNWGGPGPCGHPCSYAHEQTNEDVTPHSYTSAQHSRLMKMWPRIVTAFDASECFHPGVWRKSHVTTHSHWDSQMQTVIIIPADWWSLYWQFPLWRADHHRGHLTNFPILQRFSTGRKKPYCLNSTSCQVTFTDRDIFLPKVWQFTVRQEMISLVINV